MNLHDLLREIQKSEYFSKIDFQKGYYQMEIAKKDRNKTAFTNMGRHYHSNKMSFGLVNAPKSFQSAMNKILGGLKGFKVYIDDVLVNSSNADDHYDQLLKEKNGNVLTQEDGKTSWNSIRNFRLFERGKM